MYTHILMPTDGSSLSEQAIMSGMSFAKAIGAKVTGMHTIPLEHPDLLEAWLHRDPDWIKLRHALFEKFADRYLDFISNAGIIAGVTVDCILIKEMDPFRAIIKTADEHHCDLIFMASHGWRGDQTQLLGGETQKVLFNSQQPVLIYKKQSTMH